MLQSFGQAIEFTGLFLVIIPLILGTLLVLMARNAKKLVVNNFSYAAQIYGGFIGIVIHEMSHLIVALLFFHKIKSFRLLRFPNQMSDDQSLGYVNHTWNPRSFYQRVGNLFIGIAPIIGNTVAILYLTKWLFPTLLPFLMSRFTTNPVVDASPLVWWHVIVWFLLIVNICIGGFDLSQADLSNSVLGVISFITVFVLLNLVMVLLNQGSTLISTVQGLMLPFIFSMGLALLLSIFVNLMIRGLILLR